MSLWADQMLDELGEGLGELADPARAAKKAKYMRDQFAFFGVPSPECKLLARGVSARVGLPPGEADLDAFARACFGRPQREFQYVAVTVLQARVKMLTSDSVPLVHHLVSTKSWWDTVDALASHVAGGLVTAHPELVTVMDEWAASDHMWVARTAILHQLRYKARTDEERLFGYCLLRANEADFFYRKAIGWALREYAKTNPEAVRRFCAQHQDTLSPLSIREATRRL